MKITRASLVLEVDGKTCAANLSTVNLDLMVDMIAALTDSGTLRLCRLKRMFGGVVWVRGRNS